MSVTNNQLHKLGLPEVSAYINLLLLIFKRNPSYVFYRLDFIRHIHMHVSDIYYLPLIIVATS